jgi:hypothetical protein
MPMTEYERGQALGPATTHETCCRCGVEFGMPKALRDVRLADHGNFYCPLGHPQHYTAGKTEVELEREKRERAEADRDFWMREEAAERERAEAEKRRHAATKGQLTKAKKRIGNGVCPCCNRHFSNVERHMATQHPDFAVG